MVTQRFDICAKYQVQAGSSSQQESGPSTWLDSGNTSLMSAPSPAVNKRVDEPLKTASVNDLNKALDMFKPRRVVHDDIPRPGSVALLFQLLFRPSNPVRREEGKGEEVQKRRVIADKIERSKSYTHFNFFMSHVVFHIGKTFGFSLRL